MLQMKLTMGLHHRAGLNPKAYRMFVISRQWLGSAKRNVLQGDLLTLFLSLSVLEQVVVTSMPCLTIVTAGIR